MGFKTKIFLLAIVAALIGYIWYFHVEFSQNTIVFTVAIVLMFLIDWAESNPAKPRSFTPKIILFVILAALIFYVWYFDVSFNQDVISFYYHRLLIYSWIFF